jgi:hypothetical protein
MFECTYDNDRIRVIYPADMPQEVQAALDPLFDRWAWIVPRICDQIRVFYSLEHEDGDGEEVLGASETSSEYRVASLYFYPAWFCEQPISRERVFVHELCHIIVAPLAEQADFITAHCSGDETLRAFVEEQNRRVLEGVVTDMEQLMLRARTPLTAVQPWPYQ